MEGAPAEAGARNEGFVREQGTMHASVCLPKPDWLAFPGVGHRAHSAPHPDHVGQRPLMLAVWPRPALDCFNKTCSPEGKRCPDKEYLHVGGLLPECDRHHLVELMAFIHDVIRADNRVYWADAGTLLGAYREGGHIGHESDIDIKVRRADFPGVRRAVEAAIQKQGLPFVWATTASHATLSYSKENKLHVDIWQADIALDEVVDATPVESVLVLKPIEFPRDPEAVWKWVAGERLKVSCGSGQLVLVPGPPAISPATIDGAFGFAVC